MTSHHQLQLSLDPSNLVCMLVAQSCPPLCDPMDCSPLGYSVYGTLQTRILEWVAMPSPRGSPQTRDQTHVFCISRQFLYHSTTWEAHFTIFYASKVMLKILQARLQQYVNVNF